MVIRINKRAVEIAVASLSAIAIAGFGYHSRAETVTTVSADEEVTHVAQAEAPSKVKRPNVTAKEVNQDDDAEEESSHEEVDEQSTGEQSADEKGLGDLTTEFEKGDWAARPTEDIKLAIQQDLANKDTYTIRWGDTLSRIAEASETTTEQLASLNNIQNVDLIIADEELHLK